jgi:hypothetical protein
MRERDRGLPVVEDAYCPDIFCAELVHLDVLGMNARLTFATPKYDIRDGQRTMTDRVVSAKLIIPVSELDRIARMLNARGDGAALDQEPSEPYRLAS